MFEFVIMPLIIGYFIGTIPFGLLLTRWAGLGDIRNIGSGNIGATNVLRTGNKKLALLTLLLDAGKGVLAVLLVEHFTWASGLPAAVGVTLGHCFPIWLKFKGGKGVATALGALLAIMPFAGLAVCATWAVTFYFTRISSLSAILGFLIAPLAAFLFYHPDFMYLTSLISLIVILRHKDNIKRLMRGEEPKFKSSNADTSKAL